MKNRALQWKDLKLGLLIWFETNRIIGRMKKPTNTGKILQLLANAFLKNGLLEEQFIGLTSWQVVNLFHEWAENFRLKGSHVVYDTGEVLPYARIELLKDSNGVIVTIGDKSHPTGVEIQYCYPTWAERNEVLLKQNTKAFQQFSKVLLESVQP